MNVVKTQSFLISVSLSSLFSFFIAMHLSRSFLYVVSKCGWMKLLVPQNTPALHATYYAEAGPTKQTENGRKDSKIVDVRIA